MKTNINIWPYTVTLCFLLWTFFFSLIIQHTFADDVIILDSPPGKTPNYLIESPIITPFEAKSLVSKSASLMDDIPQEKPAVIKSDKQSPQQASDNSPPSTQTQPEVSDNKPETPKNDPGKSTNIPPVKESTVKESNQANSVEEQEKPANSNSSRRSRNHQCIPPKEYPIGDIPLEILDYNKLTLPAVCRKPDPETAEDLIELEQHVLKITKEVISATVCVRSGSGSGSGVVISEDGWILTAAHVCIKPGRTFSVIFPDGKKVKAITYGTNHEDDAGLMKIVDEGKWPSVGVAAQPIEESSWTLCTGHPGGIQDDRPPVLRLGRVIRSCQHVVRTDNLIMPGDSGGPVFDMYGRVVAINSRIGPSQSLNYHVPAWVFLRDWDRLEKKESWGSSEDASDSRGFLGVELERGGDEAKIKSIMPGLPAEKAELKAGDVILDVNGREVRSFEDLVGYLSRKKAGDKVTLKVQRGSEEFTKEIVLADPPVE